MTDRQIEKIRRELAECGYDLPFDAVLLAARLIESEIEDTGCPRPEAKITFEAFENGHYASTPSRHRFAYVFKNLIGDYEATSTYDKSREATRGFNVLARGSCRRWVAINALERIKAMEKR